MSVLQISNFDLCKQLDIYFDLCKPYVCVQQYVQQTPILLYFFKRNATKQDNQS